MAEDKVKPKLNTRQRLTANLSKIKDVDPTQFATFASNMSNLANFDAHNLSKINPKAAYCTVTEKEVIKYVRTPTSIIKSSFAFIAIVIATILLFWQLYQKILSFATNPVQTASKFDYPNSLALPAIILCNTEPLRISYVSNTPAMQVFNHFYTGNITVNSAKYAQLLNDSDHINTSQFYADGGLQKEDFILKCTLPSGSPCNIASEFTFTTTDYGNCYSFNTDSKKSYNVSSAGPSSGLRLTLNIATYESMRGPYNTIGAKIALYPQKQVPIVAQIGLDAPPGFQTAIALATKESVRLPKNKKGNCDPNASLKLYNMYSYEACVSEQAFANIQSTCGCSPYNTPRIINSTVCTIEQQLDCVAKAMRSPSMNTNSSTVCTETCSYRFFDTSLTYSLISVDQAVSTLGSDQLLNMLAAFRNATQIRSSSEAETRLQFDYKVAQLVASYKSFEAAMLDPVVGEFQELQARLIANVPCYKQDFPAINSLTTVPNDWVRKKNSSELLQAASDISDVGTKLSKLDFTTIYSLISTLASGTNSTVVKTQLAAEYQTILDALQSQQIVATQTYTSTSSFYSKDQLLINNQIYFNSVNVSLQKVITGLQQTISQCNTTMNSVNTLSQTHLNSSTNTLETLIKDLKSQCSDTVATVNSYESAYSYALSNYTTVLTTLQTFKMDQLSLYMKLNAEQIVTFTDDSFEEILQLCQAYLNGDLDKLTFAQQLTDNYGNYWLTLQDHFSRLRTQVLSTRITVENFLNRINMINNNFTTSYLNLANIEYLGKVNQTILTATCVKAVRSYLLNFINVTTINSNIWSKSFSSLLTDLTTYMSSFQVDDTFYKNNLVMFNIYFRDLSVQKTEQFLMYDVQTMISDIAGTAGIIIAFFSTSGVAIMVGCSSIGRTLRGKVCPKRENKPNDNEGLDVVQVVEKEQTYTTNQAPTSIINNSTPSPPSNPTDNGDLVKPGRIGSAAVLDVSQSITPPPIV